MTCEDIDLEGESGDERVTLSPLACEPVHACPTEAVIVPRAASPDDLSLALLDTFRTLRDGLVFVVRRFNEHGEAVLEVEEASLRATCVPVRTLPAGWDWRGFYERVHPEPRLLDSTRRADFSALLDAYGRFVREDSEALAADVRRKIEDLVFGPKGDKHHAEATDPHHGKIVPLSVGESPPLRPYQQAMIDRVAAQTGARVDGGPYVRTAMTLLAPTDAAKAHAVPSQGPSKGDES